MTDQQRTTGSPPVPTEQRRADSVEDTMTRLRDVQALLESVAQPPTIDLTEHADAEQPRRRLRRQR